MTTQTAMREMHQAMPELLDAYDNQEATKRELILRAIAEAAWAVLREQPGYNPCPDPILRKDEQDWLWKLLDTWKGMKGEA